MSEDNKESMVPKNNLNAATDWDGEQLPVEPQRRFRWIAWLAVPVVIAVFVAINYRASRREIREPVVLTQHILIKCDKYKPGNCDEAYARIREIKKKIDAGADFSALARQFSEDETTAAAGGYVGYTTYGQLVEEYAKVAFSMKEGEVSDIVQSSYGYHIIKLLSRRNPIGWKPDSKPVGSGNGGHSN